MHRHFFVLISILFLSVSMFADNDLPIFLMHWNLGVDWHDMFDALNCRKVEENRHAANMSAVCYKYRYTAEPFLIVPIIGAMFADLINTGIVTLFLNIL